MVLPFTVWLRRLKISILLTYHHRSIIFHDTGFSSHLHQSPHLTYRYLDIIFCCKRRCPSCRINAIRSIIEIIRDELVIDDAMRSSGIQHRWKENKRN